MKRALLVIAKRPRAGHTKTRLTPPLSPEQAAALYECLLQDTLSLARKVPGQVTIFVLYSPEAEKDYFRQLAPDLELLLQRGDDLGARLDNAIGDCLALGYEQVIVMNSDGPTLPPGYITQGFATLSQADVVFGRSEDGGYYLIGATRQHSRLVREVQMSTPTVLQDTLAIAAEENLNVELLPEWFDVDTIIELRRLAYEIADKPDCAPKTAEFLRGLEL